VNIKLDEVKKLSLKKLKINVFYRYQLYEKDQIVIQAHQDRSINKDTSSMASTDGDGLMLNVFLNENFAQHLSNVCLFSFIFSFYMFIVYLIVDYFPI
jgi:hypothetical protein